MSFTKKFTQKLLNHNVTELLKNRKAFKKSSISFMEVTFTLFFAFIKTQTYKISF